MTQPTGSCPYAVGERQRGFSLLEVLVALVITSVGMLGLAKIQALAYASTGTASLRSIAALEGASLATAMRTNRNYWTVTQSPNLSVTVTGTSIVSSDATLQTGTSTLCVYPAVCTPGLVAAFDLYQWVNTLNTGLLPNPTANIACAPTVTGSPIGCTITISWTERNVAINTQAAAANVAASAAGSTAMAAPTYSLYVEP